MFELFELPPPYPRDETNATVSKKEKESSSIMDRRSYPLMPWFTIGTPSLAEAITQSSSARLVTIARAFRAVNIAILQEARRDKERSDHEARYYNQITESEVRFHQPLRWHFANGDLETLDLLIQSRIPSESEDLSQLLQSLEEGSCLHVWRAGLESLIAYLGSSSDQPSWRSAKQRALDVLTQRDVAAENFERLQFTQRTAEVERFCDRIREKLQLMERFVAVYDAQPVPVTMEHQPASEPLYDLYPLAGRYTRTIAEAYPNLPQHKNGPALITAITLTTLACIFLLAVAWQNSTNRQGSSADADFYLLILNSVMCVLGIFTAIFPFFWKQASDYNRWARGVSVLGVLAAVSAVPMYCYLPTMWSALVAFLAQAVQSVVTLQLALATEQEL